MRGAAIGLGVLGLMVFGFMFLGTPAPTIIVAPETIFHIGALAVTNTMFTSWIVVFILCAVALYAGPRMQLVPTGFSGVIEGIVAGFYGVVEGVVGEARARQFFFLAATIFFYVIVSNYFGLLPGNMFIGKPEIGHGRPPVQMNSTTIAGIDVMYIPFNPKAGEAHHEAAPADSHAADPKAADAKTATKVESKTESKSDAKTESKATAKDDHAADPKTADAKNATKVESKTEGKSAAKDDHAAEDTHGEQYGILAPFLRSVNTDPNTPLAIAIYSFIFVELWGFQALGFGYLKKFFNFGALAKGPMGAIDFIVGLLELVSELSRLVSFTFRLFGNVFAGEVLLTMMGFLVPLVLIDVFYGLELFVGAIQAFVFAMLTLVFAQSAVAHHGGDHEEGHEAAH